MKLICWRCRSRPSVKKKKHTLVSCLCGTDSRTTNSISSVRHGDGDDLHRVMMRRSSLRPRLQIEWESCVACSAMVIQDIDWARQDRRFWLWRDEMRLVPNLEVLGLKR